MEHFSRIIAGLWRLTEWSLRGQPLLTFIETCLEAGITSFDHADIYGDYQCEELFGNALALKPVIRENIQLITKCGIKLVSSKNPGTTVKHYDTSRKHIILSVEHSLRNLRTDYLDLLLIHRPDPLMHAAEIADTFSELRESGKVKYFGVSNFTNFQFELLAAKMDFPMITNQVEYSVLHPDPMHDGTFDFCQQHDISPMAWSPFGSGRLFHKENKQILRVKAALKNVSNQFPGSTIDQIALAWILCHPVNIYPVLGTGKIERLLLANKAIEISLSREQWFSIWIAVMGHDVP